ncbi:MAG TPA: GGDEF domain-containing protein [Xanthobacteraceae bacterium]|nr:GGDEF domain-containing protein [Xanthobacteraceae bacterium]
MNKRPRPKPDAGGANAGSGARGRREPEAPFAQGPRPRLNSDPMRLAAEVAKLQAELDALRARVRELEACAEVDPLTHVLNRRGFERELARAIAYARRYEARAALVYLDLDGFKPVNDRHGHAAGDAVLQALAAKLMRTARASDAVGRLGGDEFAVLLWNLGEADARQKAQALERALGATAVPWEGQMLRVGASAGVAYLQREDAPGDVLARADRAMYARKAQRRAALSGA